MVTIFEQEQKNSNNEMIRNKNESNCSRPFPVTVLECIII